uniref:Uncharacterized protein n=1 Tax=Solanum tuberosum TaxID=4113 RepID=M1DC02_SOLTU
MALSIICGTDASSWVASRALSRGRGTTGGTGAIGGTGASTVYVGEKVVRDLAESGRDLARISTLRNCIEGFAPPSFITMPRAHFTRQHVEVGSSHICKNIKKNSEQFKQRHRKTVGDKLAKSVSETPNLFGEPDRARRKDWLKILQKYYCVGDGMSFSANRRQHSANRRLTRRKLQCIFMG